MKNKIIVRWLRRVIYLVAGLGIFYLSSSYGVRQMGSDNDSLRDFVQPDETVIIQKRNIEFKRGRYVFFKLTHDGSEYLATGKIYAGAGDAIVLDGDTLQTPLGKVQLKKNQVSLWQALNGQVLQKGEYLIFNADLESLRPDARDTGVVGRDKLLYRIILGLKF